MELTDQDVRAHILGHIPVIGTWTMQRVGVKNGGKFRWRLYDDGVPESLSGPLTREQAMERALEYINGLAKE